MAVPFRPRHTVPPLGARHDNLRRVEPVISVRKGLAAPRVEVHDGLQLGVQEAVRLAPFLLMEVDKGEPLWMERAALVHEDVPRALQLLVARGLDGSILPLILVRRDGGCRSRRLRGGGHRGSRNAAAPPRGK